MLLVAGAGDLVAEWTGEFPRLLVAGAGDGPADFGPWRFAGVSLLPNHLVAGLPDRFAGLYLGLEARVRPRRARVRARTR